MTIHRGRHIGRHLGRHLFSIALLLLTLSPPLFSEANRTIVINSAGDLSSYISRMKDERYFELSGDVSLSFSEDGESATHHIRADYLFLNREKSLLTAKGNVEYVLEQKGSREIFRGESLIFNIDDMTGLFFGGESEKKQSSDEKSIEFHYRGERIQRLQDGSVLLVNGLISSSKKNDPYYSIKAEQISILKPGEWAVRNAFLYLGRVPILPLPFFFMPGDTFVFHPSYGYSETKGYFVQTTTYLRGFSREDQSGGLSILQYLDEDDRNDYSMVREGLFLQREPLQEGETPDTGYLKLMADYYHILGAHFALEGKWEKSSLSAGIAFTREIYNPGNFGYSFLDPVAGIDKPIWQQPTLFSLQFPFRFYVELSSDLPLGDSFSGTIRIPLFSDPAVKSLFYPRKEGMQWKEFIDPDTVLEGEMNPLKNLVPEITLKTRKKLYLDQGKRIGLSLSFLRFKGSLSSRDGSGDDEYPLSWYYTDYLVAPDLAFSLDLSLLDSQKKSGGKAPNLESMDKPPPWVNSEVEEQSQASLNPPGPPSLSPVVKEGNRQVAKWFSNSLSLSLTPQVSHRSVFNSQGISTMEEQSILPDYHVRKLAIGGALDYKADVGDGFFRFQNSIKLNGSYQEHVIESESMENDFGESSDHNAHRYEISNLVSMDLYPLISYTGWGKSAITYSGDGKLFRGLYLAPTDESISHIPLNWDQDSIKSHFINGRISFESSFFSHSLNGKVLLPPLDERYELSYTGANNLLTLKISEQIHRDDSRLLFDPFQAELLFTPLSWLSFQEKLFLKMDGAGEDYLTSGFSLSFFDKNLTTSHSFSLLTDTLTAKDYSGNIKVFPFYANLEAAREYDYVIGTSGWKKVEDVYFFRPTRIKTGISWDLSPEPFWKGRIDLSLAVDTSWEMHLIRYTENRFAFSLELDLWIARFLDLQVSMKSSNNRTYNYFSSFTNGQPVSFLEDLLKSFSFFNIQDRLDSNFNLETISIRAVHEMNDWDLNFVYEGKPELKTNSAGIPEYSWIPEFSIFLQWRPIPEIRKKVSYQDEEVEW